MPSERDKASENDNAKWRQFGLRKMFFVVILVAVALHAGIWFYSELYTAWHFAAVDVQIQRVNVGMTQAEVRTQWGPPTRTGDSMWTYWFAEAHFDEDGRVTRIEDLW
ncbi:MAG TPA: hypothetical protein QF564_29710 [Pirellulaceae bacterium]|nr:hypothetical protein [Pirellulaceae bacterium]